MSPELQQAFVTYVIPALILAFLEVRRRRMTANSKTEANETNRRTSDFEIGQELRDEIRKENADLRDEVRGLRRRVGRLDDRVRVLTELLVRHGVPVPTWEDAEETA